MAKSERTSGGKGKTHYNNKEKRVSTGRTAGGGSERPYREERGQRDESKPYSRKPAGDRKPFGKSSEGERPYPRKESSERKPYREGGAGRPERGERPYKKREDDRRPAREDRGERKPFKKEGERTYAKREDKPYGKREERPYGKREERPYGKREERTERPDRTERPARAERPTREERPTRSEGKVEGIKRRAADGERKERKPIARKAAAAPADRRRSDTGRGGKKPYDRKGGKGAYQKRDDIEKDVFDEYSNPAKPGKWETEVKGGPMTLNKYLAHSGASSRRDAANIIKEGKVTVNGKVLTEPGYRVQPNDKVTMNGMVMKPQTHFVYVLLNKPKDFLTTTEDDRGRRTVMELVAGATEDRLYPIGRLDRNTTGVLLLTNDGDLAQRLSHPRYESKKIYQVTLDKDVTKKDFDKILEGVELEDGPAKVDRLAYLEKKNEIGLEIHSGRNRIVRRIFESLGYEVEKLDRVMYAGLTKKNVSRGKWRFLTDKEVIMLKHFKS